MSKPPQGGKRRLKGKTKMLLAVSISVGVTLVLTLLFLNLRAGEKQIRYELTHRFAVSDPQFVRSMNHLLGPGILAGNRIKALQNGDEIFPAMLDFGAEQVKVFEEDKSKSRLMTRAEFKNRSKVGKMFDEIAGTLRRQL